VPSGGGREPLSEHARGDAWSCQASFVSRGKRLTISASNWGLSLCLLLSSVEMRGGQKDKRMTDGSFL